MILLGKGLSYEQNLIKILGSISGWDFEDEVGLDCGVEVWSKFGAEVCSGYWSWTFFNLRYDKKAVSFKRALSPRICCAFSNVQTLCTKLLWTCSTSRRGVRIRGSRVRGGARCSRGSSMAPWRPTPVGCSASPAFRRKTQFITSYFCQNSFG